MLSTQMLVNMHERFYVNTKIAYLISYLVAFISGALLPLAFAPFDFWPIAILSPLTLLMLWNRASPLKACFLGGSFGLGLFGVGISWVFVSIHRYGNTIIPVAIFITFLLVAICAAYIALQGYLLKRFFNKSNATLWLIGFPCSWVLIEWFRGWLFTGFPWLYLGYSQLNTPLAGFAPILGVYGISFVLALIAGLCVNFYYAKKISKILSFILISSIFFAGFMLQKIQWTTAMGNPTTVSMIQGNIGPLDKFTQADPIDATDKIYGKLTQTVLNSSLILWPESAIPLPYPHSKEYIKKLNKLAAKHKTTLITGMQFINEKGEYFNSLIALGNGRGIYHKHHLVPFGDFVPFEYLLRGLVNFFDLPMSSFMSGPAEQKLITAGALTLDPLICYEIAFPELVRETLRNANAIITLSEDGWFGESFGPHQHLQIARMRALENGRYVLRSTTSGITAIIDDKGQITKKIPAFEASILTGTFQAMTGSTPWTKIGQWPILALLLGLFLTPMVLNILTKHKNFQ